MYFNKMSIIAGAIPVLLVVAICVQAIPRPSEDSETEMQVPEVPEASDAQGTETSSSSSSDQGSEPESEVTQAAPVTQVAKPKFVCNAKCAGYAELYQVRKFKAARCCIFLPCPKTNLYPAEYERFKMRVCGRVGKCD